MFYHTNFISITFTFTKKYRKTLKNIRLISYNTETWSKIANDKGFIKQFESYLQGVNKIEDLAYVINSNKANINEVKQAFKELFKNKKDELFEIIRKNRNLSESLDIDNISDLTSEKISDIVEIIIKTP